MGALVDPFADNPFLVRALVAGVLVAIACAVVGTYVVLRGLAFMGEALGHGVLPGVAIAILAGGPGLAGAAVAAVVMIAGVSTITSRTRLTSTTAIGLLFVGMLALGVVIVSRSDTFTGDLTRILFGDVLGVSWGDIWIQLGTTVAVGGLALLCARPFLLLCFDAEQAQAAGFPPRRYETLLLALIGATVVVSFQTVGTLLVVGMLLAPASAAVLMTARVGAAIAVAAGLGLLAVVGGLLLSYHADIAAGAGIVLVAVCVFFLVLAGNGLRRTVAAARS